MPPPIIWFNVGLHHVYGVGKNSTRGNWFYDPKTQKAERASTQYEYPQCGACFIQSVGDDMESIMDLAKSEAMLFKFGSGEKKDAAKLLHKIAEGRTALTPQNSMRRARQKPVGLNMNRFETTRFQEPELSDANTRYFRCHWLN